MAVGTQPLWSCLEISDHASYREFKTCTDSPVQQEICQGFRATKLRTTMQRPSCGVTGRPSREGSGGAEDGRSESRDNPRLARPAAGAFAGPALSPREAAGFGAFASAAGDLAAAAEDAGAGAADTALFALGDAA